MNNKSVLVTAVLVFAFASAAFAQPWAGSGDANDPYQIADANDLNEIGLHDEDWGAHFVMVNDVNLAGYTGTQFNVICGSPDGGWYTMFEGVFDGNGHVIKNLNLEVDISMAGLFGYIGNGGVVKNVCLDGVDIKAIHYVGGIAGRNEGVIQNCHVSGIIEGEQACGGITGACLGGGLSGPSQIRNCSFRGQVTGTYDTGGVVGSTDGPEIIKCYAIVEIIGEGQCGGIVGHNTGGNLQMCFSKGSITCSSGAGGFVGVTYDHCGYGGDIRDCYADVTVNCSNYAGGFSGSAPGQGQISNCYCSGKVVYDANNHTDVGGFIGEDRTPEGVFYSYFLETAGLDNGFGEPLSEEQMKQRESFAGWDFVGETVNGTLDIWDICEGTNYPKLVWSIPTGDFICPDGVNMLDFAMMASDWLKPAVPHEWLARYNDPENSVDIARAIAIDSNDNIYVTGRSTGTGTDYDYATVKYSPDSNKPVWVARYDGPDSSYDEAWAIAVDSNDNIYVTGHSRGSGTFDDYATIKYSPDSNQPVWIARYNSPANSSNAARAIAVDSNGNVYVTGYSWESGTSADYVTIKYSPDSNQPVWVARYNGPGNNVDMPRAIAVDSQDNIYVTGRSLGVLDTHNDYATIKYSPDSNQPVWIARYNGPGGINNDFALAITVDSNDNIYVTGESTDPVALGLSDFATVKYSPDSNEAVWVARYNGPPPGNGTDVAYAITVDSNDNIYVVGRSEDPDTGADDYATIKYSPDSNQPAWVARYNSPANGVDRPYAIAVDNQDNIYVTGESEGSGTDDDYATIKYSPDSNEPIWVARYNGLGNSDDVARAIALDSEDNIYVTGNSFGSGTDYDYATIKYLPEHTCTPEITGDFDFDCDVDFYDLEIFCQNWLDHGIE